MAKKYNEVEVKDNMNVNGGTEEETVTEEKKEAFKSVVSAKPTKVKKSLFGRLVTGMVGPEGLPGIGAYVNDEIVKPAIKNIIVDAVTSGINMVMYGEKGGPGRGGYRPSSGSRGYSQPRTNYSTSYNRAPEPAQERVVTRTARQGVEDYVIADRADASEVLVSLTESADRYDTVSIADYYDLIGVAPQFTDNNHGWSFDSISRASIIPVRGGYVIKFPPVEVI